MNVFRWPSIIFWSSGRSRGKGQVEKGEEQQQKEKDKEKDLQPEQPQQSSLEQPPIQRISQSVGNLPKMVHFSASTFGGISTELKHQEPKFDSTMQHWMFSREPVYYAVPATVVNMAPTMPMTMSMSTPNLRATLKTGKLTDGSGGRSLSLPLKPPAGRPFQPSPPSVVISPLVYRVPQENVVGASGDSQRQSSLPPPPPLPRIARKRSARANYDNKIITSDLLLLQKLHTRLTQLPAPAEVNKRLCATVLRVEGTLKRMQQMVWFTNDPFIITRIVPVSPHCFDHHEPAAEEGRLALFIVVLDLISSAHYLSAFYHMLISAYGGQLGVPAHLLDQIKMAAAENEIEGGGGYIELPSYVNADGCVNSGSSPPILVRIRLTLEWASFIDRSGWKTITTDHQQKRTILANWVIIKRVQWYGRLARKGNGLTSALLIQLMQDVRRRFTILRLLTPWKLTLLGEYFGRSSGDHPIPLDVAFRRFFEAAAGNLFQQPFNKNFNTISPIPYSLAVCITGSMPDDVQVKLQLAFYILNFLLHKWEVGSGRQWSSSSDSDYASSHSQSQSCSQTGANIVLGLGDATTGLPTSLLALLRCIAE